MRTEAQTVQTQHVSEIGQLQSEKQALESENALLKREQAKARTTTAAVRACTPCARAQIDLTVNAGERRQLIDLSGKGWAGSIERAQLRVRLAEQADRCSPAVLQRPSL